MPMNSLKYPADNLVTAELRAAKRPDPGGNPLYYAVREQVGEEHHRRRAPQKESTTEEEHHRRRSVASLILGFKSRNVQKCSPFLRRSLFSAAPSSRQEGRRPFTGEWAGPTPEVGGPNGSESTFQGLWDLNDDDVDV